MIELVGVVVTAEAKARLDRCAFEVRAGEVLGLVGPTGAGKTTALAVLGGLLGPARGRVLLEGRDVSRKPDRLRALAGMAGHVLPGPYDLNVYDWLALWAGMDGVARGERTARIDDAIKQFALAGDTRVEQLSHGGHRRLGFARLWVRRPRLYLLDAPDEGLDGDGLRRLTGAIRAVVADGATVVIGASSPHLASTICDRVVGLAGGAATGLMRRSDASFSAQVARAAGWAA